jgi:tRNA (guanine9-N1)-methyltransferase
MIHNDITRLTKQEKKCLKREKLKQKWEDQKNSKKQKKADAKINTTAEEAAVDPVRTEQRRERKRIAAEQRTQKELTNPEILIDCDFHDKMTSTEQASIAVQLAHSYSVVNKMQKRPVRLALCGAREELLDRLKKNSGFDQWNLQIYDHKIDRDPRPKENLIYLTPDAEEELDLDQLNQHHVLVIGGFVDRNRHKGLTFKKASELGVQTAKLPLKNFVHLIASQVLTVNHVVDILATALDTGCWETAVKKVVPERKVVQ